MKLSSFTDQRFIDLNVAGVSRDDVISSLAGLMSRSPNLKDKDVFLKDVLSRERLVTTGVGHGVAFPHAKSDAVRNVIFAFGRTTGDIDFGALDGQSVRLVFLIGAPKQLEPSRVYLNLMARLSFLMKSEGNRSALLSTDSVAEVLKLIDSVG